jgi:hypothetical protein
MNQQPRKLNPLTGSEAPPDFTLQADRERLKRLQGLERLKRRLLQEQLAQVKISVSIGGCVALAKQPHR